MPDWGNANWLAIVIATVASIVIGYVWYLPSVFGRQWASAAGQEVRSPGSYPAMTWVIGVVINLIAAYVLALFAGGKGTLDGLVIAFTLWAGFTGTVLAGAVLFEGKSWSWWYISAGYYLVGTLAMGAILGYFPATM